MPQAIVWAFGVLGGAALVRWAVREIARVNRELEQSRMTPEPVVKERLPRLRRDPVTGVYRPE
jgi:hypothetical protein